MAHGFTLRISWIISILAFAFCGCNQQQQDEYRLFDSIIDSYHDFTTDFSEEDIDHLEWIADSLNSRYGHVWVYLDRANTYLYSDIDQAIHNIEQAQILIREDDPPKLQAYSDLVRAVAYELSLNYDKAVASYLQAIDLYIQDKDHRRAFFAYQNLSYCYAAMGDMEKLKECIEKERQYMQLPYHQRYTLDSIRVYAADHPPLQVLQTLHTLSGQLQPFDTNAIITVSLHYDLQSQLEETYERLGMYDSALCCIDTLEYINRWINNQHYTTLLAYLKGGIFFAQHRYPEAIAQYKELINNQERYLTNISQAALWNNLIDSYHALHQDEEAYACHLHYKSLMDSMAVCSRNNDQAFRQIEAINETRMAQAEARQKRLSVCLNIIIYLALILAVTFVIVLYRKVRIQRLYEQQIIEGQKKIFASQMERAETQEQIQTYVDQMRQIASNMPKHLKTMALLNLNQLELRQEINAWQQYEEAFAQEYGNFKERLAAAFPSISDSELRLCMLIKANRSIPEMADTLHVTPQSIRTYRYRIKKKISPANESFDLDQFIRDF